LNLQCNIIMDWQTESRNADDLIAYFTEYHHMTIISKTLFHNVMVKINCVIDPRFTYVPNPGVGDQQRHYSTSSYLESQGHNAPGSPPPHS